MLSEPAKCLKIEGAHCSHALIAVQQSGQSLVSSRNAGDVLSSSYTV